MESIDSIDADLAIQACERALEVAGAEVGDIRTAHSMLAQPILVTILRVYRQGDGEQRERFLHVIDHLSEVNDYGLEEVCKVER